MCLMSCFGAIVSAQLALLALITYCILYCSYILLLKTTTVLQDSLR